MRKKAVMDDITLLTRSQEVMRNTSERLDSLVAWGRMMFGKEFKFSIAGESMPSVKEEPVNSLGSYRGNDREEITQYIKVNEAEKREYHLIQCAQQGQMIRWEGNVVERKIGCKL